MTSPGYAGHRLPMIIGQSLASGQKHSSEETRQMDRSNARDERFWDPAIETISRDALHELQMSRLGWQVERCHRESAFYRERFRSVGAVPDDIRTLDDFRRLPVVTKQELRDEQLARPPLGTFTVGSRADWREVHPSTGTTGVPVNTIWSSNDVRAIADFTARSLWAFGVRPGDVIQNAFAYGLWVAGLSVHYAAAAVGCLCVPTGTAVTTERQIDYLRGIGTTVLIATPSYALHIAEELRRRNISPDDLALRLGCFGGEAGAENAATRTKIERGLGIDAYDYYGLAEIGPTFASECIAKAGLHVAEDHVLVECLDPDTRKPVPEGEVGVLVYTHLTREATPMLRYWSNDYARLTTARCDCGRTHLRVPGGILGRHDDLLVYRGAKFYPVQVEKVVRSFGELADEFRIEIQREPGSSLIRTCTVVAEESGATTAPKTSESLDERLRHALRGELGVTPAVRLEPFGTLERTTFKAKRIVDSDTG
jgi:phenylacetate-CoA ligase